MKKKLLSLFVLTIGVAITSTAQECSDIQERLKWLNEESLRLAVQDMKKQKGFNASSVDQDLTYIATHLQSVWNKA